MRYVLYKLSDIDYGVLDDDIDAIFSEALGDKFSVKKSGLTEYLSQFGGEPAEGDYYKMYVDSKDWPTIGSGDLQWASHYGQFSVPGKVISNGTEMDVDNVAQTVLDFHLTKGHTENYKKEEIGEIYIEKSLVDKVADSTENSNYNTVINILAEAGLNLKMQQIYPLVAIVHSFGNLDMKRGKPGEEQRTFVETYKYASEELKYEEFSWEHNQYVWDHWWAYLGGGNAGHVFVRDFQFETYVKGIYKLEGSAMGGLEWKDKTHHVFYTKEQLQCHQEIINANGENLNLLGRELRRNEDDSNAEELFKSGEGNPGTFRWVADDPEDYIIGYWTSTTGRIFTVLAQGEIPGWSGCCNRAASAIIASGYSKETPTELVDFMDEKYVDNSIIPETDQYWYKYKLKRVEFITQYLSVDSYTEKLRNQLKKGGYAAIWVETDYEGDNYDGLTLDGWTDHIHWVAIIDYKIDEFGNEKICIADYRGADWYPIEEFSGYVTGDRQGISHLVLIEEE